MEVNLFNIVQLVLIIILIIFGLYFIYIEFFGRNYEPLLWKNRLKESKIENDLFSVSKKYKDKARFFNFWFQVERLKESSIEGAFAELGVYKGETAHILHLMDKERELHLFDTFEGFNESDLKVESDKAATYTTHSFADTSVEMVKSLFDSNNVHFHQGYFPDSTKNINNQKYALVSMDVDLYNPTISGLEYFYPLMEEGGVILIHDHNPDWAGIQKAVKEFSIKIKEPFIQLHR